jgi:hypothetical protein
MTVRIRDVNIFIISKCLYPRIESRVCSRRYPKMGRVSHLRSVNFEFE